ncbi:hypothetical protein B0H11DRAFT_1943691 [Mycena galericulata]|nr:hypothetical protein B0H11DRAFT_1943691 [Mycena galericulata]
MFVSLGIVPFKVLLLGLLLGLLLSFLLIFLNQVGAQVGGRVGAQEGASEPLFAKNSPTRAPTQSPTHILRKLSYLSPTRKMAGAKSASRRQVGGTVGGRVGQTLNDTNEAKDHSQVLRQQDREPCEWVARYELLPQAQQLGVLRTGPCLGQI